MICRLSSHFGDSFVLHLLAFLGGFFCSTQGLLFLLTQTFIGFLLSSNFYRKRIFGSKYVLLLV